MVVMDVVLVMLLVDHNNLTILGLCLLYFPSPFLSLFMCKLIFFVSADLNYLGDFNNSAELQAMRRELNSKYSASSTTTTTSSTSPGTTSNSAVGSRTRSSIADSYRKNTSTGSKMRALRPLGVGAKAAAAAVPQEEELPAGNCVVM